MEINTARKAKILIDKLCRAQEDLEIIEDADGIILNVRLSQTELSNNYYSFIQPILKKLAQKQINSITQQIKALRIDHHYD